MFFTDAEGSLKEAAQCVPNYLNYTLLRQNVKFLHWNLNQMYTSRKLARAAGLRRRKFRQRRQKWPKNRRITEEILKPKGTFSKDTHVSGCSEWQPTIALHIFPYRANLFVGQQVAARTATASSIGVIMLIKLQKTRFSEDYLLIENARNVTFRNTPLVYYREEELGSAMHLFIHGCLAKTSCWYQMEENGSGHQGYNLEFQNGYAINHISFDNEKGEREEIRFDGEAFICNDDGKTVHRIKRGGCPSVLKSDEQDSLPPKAA